MNNVGTQLTKAFDGSRSVKVESPLIEILNKFCSKNRLGKPAKTAGTSYGVIADLGKSGLVLLSSSYESNPNSPVIGGDGGHHSAEETTTYSLSGILEGQNVSLEAEITTTQRFSEEFISVQGSCVKEKVRHLIGKKRTMQRRMDNTTYWFITEPGIS